MANKQSFKHSYLQKTTRFEAKYNFCKSSFTESPSTFPGVPKSYLKQVTWTLRAAEVLLSARNRDNQDKINDYAAFLSVSSSYTKNKK